MQGDATILNIALPVLCIFLMSSTSHNTCPIYKVHLYNYAKRHSIPSCIHTLDSFSSASFTHSTHLLPHTLHTLYSHYFAKGLHFSAFHYMESVHGLPSIATFMVCLNFVSIIINIPQFYEDFIIAASHG